MKPILGLDLDGVVYPWHEELWRHLRAQGLLTNETYKTFWMREQDGSDKKYSEKQWKIWTGIETLYSCRIPIPEDLKALHRLQEAYEIVYISQRPQELLFITRQYLKRYKYPNADNVHLITVPKLVAVRMFECDVYVEDRPLIAESLVDSTRVILMKQIYNERLWDEFETVSSLPELMELLL